MDLIDGDDPVEHGVDGAGEAGEGARYDEGNPLVELHVIPHCRGTRGVLPDGLADQSQRRVDDSLHGDEAGQEHYGDKNIKGGRIEQQVRTRDAGQTILTASQPGPGIGDEIEHLIEGKGNADEVEAGPLDAEVTDRDRQHQDEQSADRQCDYERHSRFEQQSRDIGADAEEHRLPEGQHARVADQDVVSHRDNAEDQHLGDNHLGLHERADDDESQNDQEYVSITHHRLPNRPCGRRMMVRPMIR